MKNKKNKNNKNKILSGEDKKKVNLFGKFVFLFAAVFLLLSLSVLTAHYVEGKPGCPSCTGNYEHDMRIIDVQEVSVAAGKTAKVNVTIENTGNYDEEDLIVYVSDMPPGWVSKSINISELRKGEFEIITLEIIIPLYTTPRIYRMKVKADNRVSDVKRFRIEVTSGTKVQECSRDSECGDNQYCQYSVCKSKKILGEECLNDKECLSNLCNTVCAEYLNKTHEAEPITETINKTEIEDMECAINNAQLAINNAKNAIDEADEAGKETADAKAKLDEAKKALDEAKNSFESEDYKNTLIYAEEGEFLASEAEKFSEEAKRQVLPLDVSAPENAKTEEEVIIKVMSNGNPIGGIEIKIGENNYSTDTSGEVKVKFDTGGQKLIAVNNAGYEKKSVLVYVEEGEVSDPMDDGKKDGADDSWLLIPGLLMILLIIILLFMKNKK